MSSVKTIRRREVPAIGDWPSHMPLLLQRVHAMRGASNIDQAQPRLAHLLPPDSLSGIGEAAAMLMAAIADDMHILVVGDFDCDGATACAVGVRGLRMLGARRVSYAVPNRMVHGYGLSPGLVDDLAMLQPELLVTVDHGIACHAGIAAAKARGWQVLVTDHHLPGTTLPPADAIVNPNLRGDPFPSKMLAGVGVIFYVLLALRRRMHDAGGFADGLPDLSTLLDLVAVGTIADLVPLDANNRALVAAGLRRLRAGHGCPGLLALAEVAGRDMRTLCATDIGFGIAPRINAAGRLEDMGLGIECLLSDDLAQAREIASLLNQINGERRAVQQQMTDDADTALSLLTIDGNEVPDVLCLFDANWHPGVVGLVASKLKERHHRPAVAFAPSEPGSTQLRGSARSIPGLHIRDALALIDSAHPGLIDRFGGHAMAAGLSLSLALLPRFQTALHEVMQQLIDPSLLRAEIISDGELQPQEITRTCAEALRDGGPWGQAYPEPLFDGEFDVLSWRVVGERHLKLELGHAGRRLNAIEFGGWQGDPPPPRLRVAYRLEPDDYRGGDAVQLVVVHREPA